MDRDTLKRIFTENIEKWVRVNYDDGGAQVVFIVNVDVKGYVHKLKDDPEGLFWTTFDDVESVSPANEREIAEGVPSDLT